MSIRTWRAEFRPVSVGDTQDWPDELRLGRDLRKWTGLRPKNLKKHAMRRSGALLYDNDGFHEVVAHQCGCCAEYGYIRPGKCTKCPIYLARAEVPCDEPRVSGETQSPWAAFCFDGNPEPMIQWIRKALKMVVEGARANIQSKGETA